MKEKAVSRPNWWRLDSLSVVAIQLDFLLSNFRVRISLLSYIQADSAEIYDIANTYFRLMAAMFELPVTPTSAMSIHTGIIVLLAPEMWGSRWNLIAIL